MATLNGDVLNTVSATMEKVFQDARAWDVLFPDSFDHAITPSKVVDRSWRGWRLPVSIAFYGNVTKVPAQGVTHERGGGTKFTHLSGGYFHATATFGMENHEVENAQDAGIAAIGDLVGRNMQSLMTDIKRNLSMAVFSDGSGRLTSNSSAYSASVYTFNTSTDLYRTWKLREGSMVGVWASDGTTKRAGGPFYVSNISRANKTAKVTNSAGSAPTSAASGDFLTVWGIDSYGPSSPSTAQSSYPSFASGSGIDGDSWIHGIEYFADTSTSNYYFGLQRSAYPFGLYPKQVAASGALTFSHARRLFNVMEAEYGSDIMSEMVLLMNPGHAEALSDSLVGVQVANIQGGASFVDRTPNRLAPNSNLVIGTCPTRLTSFVNASNAYLLNTGDIGSVGEFNFELHKPMGQSTVFVDRRNVTGSEANLSSGFDVYAKLRSELVHPIPGQIGIITSITAPTYI